MPICHPVLLTGSRPHRAIWCLTGRLERTVKHKHTPGTKTKAKTASMEGTASSWKYLSRTHQRQSSLANTTNASRRHSEAGNKSKGTSPQTPGPPGMQPQTLLHGGAQRVPKSKDHSGALPCRRTSQKGGGQTQNPLAGQKQCFV